MTDSYLPLLDAAIDALRGDTSVAALVGARVYNEVPDNPVFPYIVVLINSVPYNTKDVAGMEHTLQLNIYSRKKGSKESGQIRAACYDVLNRNESGLASAGVINIEFNGIAQTVKDSDGVSWFSAMQFRTVIIA